MAILTREQFTAIAQTFLLASVNASDEPRPPAYKRGRPQPSKRAALMEAAVAAVELAGSAPNEEGGQFS